MYISDMQDSLYATPIKVSFNPQSGHDPQVENSYSIPTHHEEAR